MIRRIVGLIIVPLLFQPGLKAQTVGGVELGFTTIDEVRDNRGEPDYERLVDGGGAYALVYNRIVFLFNGADSVAVIARVLPEDMTRSEVEEIFGEARETSRKPDLSIRAIYADTLMVMYERNGEDVVFLEYRMNAATSALSELSRSLNFDRRTAPRRVVDERVAEICRTRDDVPSLQEWNETFADLRRSAGRYISEFRGRLLEDMTRTCTDLVPEI